MNPAWVVTLPVRRGPDWFDEWKCLMGALSDYL
jgi:hypothetical protein